MKPKIEFPKYIDNELTRRLPETIYVSSREEILTVEKSELMDGNKVFRTNTYCDRPLPYDGKAKPIERSLCSRSNSEKKALIVTFGASCVIDRIVVLCPECAKTMTKKQKKLLERYNIVKD